MEGRVPTSAEAPQSRLIQQPLQQQNNADGIKISTVLWENNRLTKTEIMITSSWNFTKASQPV